MNVRAKCVPLGVCEGSNVQSGEESGYHANTRSTTCTLCKHFPDNYSQELVRVLTTGCEKPADLAIKIIKSATNCQHMHPATKSK